MIAKHLKYQFRKLYASYVPAEQIKATLGIDGAIYRIAANEWPALKAKRKRHFSKVSRQTTRELKEEPMGQSYEDQQKKMELKGYTRHRVPQTCPKCRTSNTIMLASGAMCKACNESQNAAIKRVLVGVLGVLMLMLCGCQSGPREANIKVHVAGQSVVMNFKK
jgi:hypothetical protein